MLWPRHATQQWLCACVALPATLIHTRDSGLLTARPCLTPQALNGIVFDDNSVLHVEFARRNMILKDNKTVMRPTQVPLVPMMAGGGPAGHQALVDAGLMAPHMMSPMGAPLQRFGTGLKLVHVIRATIAHSRCASPAPGTATTCLRCTTHARRFSPWLRAVRHAVAHSCSLQLAPLC